MKLLTSLFVICIFLVSCGKQDTSISENDVRSCFKGYKAAILSKDGESAVKYLSKGTIDEYQSYVDLALTASPEEMKELSLITRMQVFLYRHRVPLETLKTFDGKSSLVYAIDRDWIGKNSVIKTSLGDIDISEGRATSEVIIGDQVAPNKFLFILEDSVWKFDLTWTLIESNLAFKQAAAKSGKEENDFLFLLIESVSGKAVNDCIWSPPVD